MAVTCATHPSVAGDTMSRPKVIDTFPFNNELDMLECRLTELYDAVDHFVLV